MIYHQTLCSFCALTFRIHSMLTNRCESTFIRMTSSMFWYCVDMPYISLTNHFSVISERLYWCPIAIGVVRDYWDVFLGLFSLF
jgi:hypothetical protein